MQGDVVSVERVVPAGPAAIFGLIADASRHPEIDGSGTVKQVKPSESHVLSLGSTFGMSMQMGVKYSMVSTVIEFEENRRIAWQSRPGGFIGKYVAGRIWRYELDPVEGGTLVRESWDISQDRQRVFLRLGGLPDKTAANMARTLGRIEEIVTAT
jgi:polyketide cyclase/dehydrase/lipid transport protein